MATAVEDAVAASSVGHPRPLAPFEHLMVADARPGHPMTFFLECVVEGPLHLDRLAEALADASARHPLLRSRVGWLGGRPHWLPPDVEPVLEPVSRRAWRPIDLARESAVRLVVVPLEAGDAGEFRGAIAGAVIHRIVLVAHHAALDGIAAAEFFGDVWAHYDGREPPPFEAGRSRTRSAAPAGAAAEGGFWPFALFRPRPLARRSFAAAPAPAAMATSGHAVPFAHLDLEPVIATRIRGAAAANGWSLNDVVVAAVVRASGRWNELAPGRAGNVRITLPVSLRTTGSRSPARNDIGYAFIDRTPADTADPGRLAAGIAAASRWIVETGAAEEFLRATGGLAARPWLLTAVTRLPVCFSTAVVSTIGDPARRMKAGVPRIDGFDAPGGLVIRAMRGVPPLRPGTRAAICAMTYGGGLSLSCLCSAVRRGDPRAAAREFLRLVAEDLERYADGPGSIA